MFFPGEFLPVQCHPKQVNQNQEISNVGCGNGALVRVRACPNESALSSEPWAGADGKEVKLGRSAESDWDFVDQVQGGADLPGAQRALSELYRIYWCPLYAIARHRGFGAQDAED